MTNSEVFRELAAIVGRHAATDGIHRTAIRSLHCVRMSDPSVAIPGVYDPCVCVVVQGSKQVLLGDEIYRYRPLHYLAVSVDLPVLGQVVEASVEQPYLCLKIDLDAHTLTDILAQSRNAQVISATTPRGLFVGTMDDALVGAVLRLARLLDAPGDIPVLAPMMLREIHYRLLNGEHGQVIAATAASGSTLQKVAQIIAAMKADLARPLRIEELAASGGRASRFDEAQVPLRDLGIDGQRELAETPATAPTAQQRSDGLGVVHAVQISGDAVRGLLPRT